MPHRDPTIRSRELGEGLRQAMQRAGLTGKQVAQALDVSPSFVSMLLTGKRGASEADIAAFLGVCRATGTERDRLLALRREQETPGWFQQHGTPAATATAAPPASRSRPPRTACWSATPSTPPVPP